MEKKLNTVNVKVDRTKPVRYFAYDGHDLNDELLDAVFADIDANPENWNQETYASRISEWSGMWTHPDVRLPEVVVAPKPGCGTTLCVAGQTVVRKGYHILFPKGDAETDIAVDDTGQRYSISNLAMHLLGLTFRESDELFYGANSREALDGIRDQIKSNHRHADD